MTAPKEPMATKGALERILKAIRDARRARAEDDRFGYRARTWPATEEVKDLESLALIKSALEDYEKARPLLEAVDGLTIMEIKGLLFASEDDLQLLLRAALKRREGERGVR